jgi:hypothetical protein
MRKKIIGIILSMLCFLVLVNFFSIPVKADTDTKLFIAIYGSFPIYGKAVLPDFFNNVSANIWNIGKNSAYNVSCTITITGGFKNNINKTIIYEYSELPSKRAIIFGLNDTDGFGPVKIIFIVSATNVNTTTRIAKGFQIGGFTWVPLTWFAPGIFQNLIPWLNCHSE